MPNDVGELQEVPTGWSLVSLAGLSSILSGGTPSKREPRYWQGDVPWVSGKDLKTPQLRDAIDHVSLDAIGSGTRIAPAGSVFLLVRGMGLARDLPVAVASRDMAFNQDIKALVPNDLRLGPFIRAAIYHRRDRLLSRIVPSAHGTLTLNLDDVAGFQIPVPNNVTEAVAIGDALELIHNKQGATVVETSTIEQLKLSVSTELFSRGLRGEAQRVTDIGRLPISWDVSTIGDVAVTTQYGLSVRGQAKGAYPLLRMNCQEAGRVHYRDLQFVDLDDPTFNTFRLERGDLLFNRTNSIEHVGRTAIVDDERPAVFASYLVRLRVEAQRCLPRFLNQFMNWPTTQLEIKKLASRAVGQANINASKLRTVRFPLPGLEEQREIVEILEAIDRKAELARLKQRVLDDLFRALLHKLMIGEIRIADLDLSALTNRATQTAA
ncbi:MAG TPA: restriction endonuclease subunit S [Gemmatimonadaceae bacterium]|nr:restriction endonuclease subunit S [Gemmatimonadaceae bacterium]